MIHTYQNTFSLPAPGGVRQVKLAENDRPIPTDRVFWQSNHFQNVFQVGQMQHPIDRYTFGAEKTFFDGWDERRAAAAV